MHEVLDAFLAVLPARRVVSANGWISFQCRACRDTRWPGRGKFYVTPTGGFRAACFNAGCDYQVRPTGWEPGHGLGGRPRRWFEIFGGNVVDIPVKYLMRSSAEFNRNMDIVGETKQEFVWDFPKIADPPGIELLRDARGRNAEAVRKYVRGRGEFFMEEFDFCWMPKHPRHVIIPFFHYGKLVGWTGRAIDDDEPDRHIKCTPWPTHYMLNQDKVNDQRNRRLIVVEGSFDAIALRCLCPFGSKLTQEQINLLKNTGKDVVLLPDFQKTEWESFYNTAVENDFYLSTPWNVDGDTTIKDVGASVKEIVAG